MKILALFFAKLSDDLYVMVEDLTLPDSSSSNNILVYTSTLPHFHTSTLPHFGRNDESEVTLKTAQLYPQLQ